MRVTLQPDGALALYRPTGEVTLVGAAHPAYQSLRALYEQVAGPIPSAGPAARLADRVEAAAAATERDPSPARRLAGDYRKGRVTVHGLTFVIENPRGSIRSGYGAGGERWEAEMPHHYGYLVGKGVKRKGIDGDCIDAFMGPHPESELVFVVDQHKPDGSFDEHKCLLGFRYRDEAHDGYLNSYAPGWKGLGALTACTLPDFQRWLERGRTTQPIPCQDLSGLLSR